MLSGINTAPILQLLFKSALWIEPFNMGLGWISSIITHFTGKEEETQRHIHDHARSKRYPRYPRSCKRSPSQVFCFLGAAPHKAVPEFRLLIQKQKNSVLLITWLCEGYQCVL